MSTSLTAVTAFTHTFLFLFRLPLLLTVAIGYFGVLQYLPLPAAVRKLALWCVMGTAGIWWVDLQLDGVKRGTLADQPPSRFPRGGSVLAANFTSPIDAIYLAAVFDPIFTVSFPDTRKVRRVGLLQAVFLALAPVRVSSGNDNASDLVDIADLLAQNPDRSVAVFPECSTTNGKAILPFGHTLLDVPADTPIFPVSLRYTPGDVTTPVPGRWFSFLWNLLSRPTSLVRVRIADATTNSTAAKVNGTSSSNADGLRQRNATATPDEQKVLDRIAEALARLGRVKRVGLTLQDKAKFIQALSAKKA